MHTKWQCGGKKPCSFEYVSPIPLTYPPSHQCSSNMGKSTIMVPKDSASSDKVK